MSIFGKASKANKVGGASLSEDAGAATLDLKRSKSVRRPAIDPAKVSREPPHSIEAEQCALGCILWDAKQCLPVSVERLDQLQDPWYDLRHELVFKQICALQDESSPVDLSTLQQKLKDNKELELVGGLAYLSSLMDAVPSAANLEFYLDTMEEKAVLRNGIRMCSEFIGKAYENEGAVNELVDGLERDALKIRPALNGKIKTAKQLVNAGISIIERMFNSKGAVTGLATGLIDLDKLLDGLHNELILIAGYPSTGKTALAMNIVEHVVTNGEPAGVITLEMSDEQLMLRMQSSLAKVDLRDITRGIANEADFRRLTQASAILSKSSLHIRQTSSISVDSARAIARRLKQEHGIKLLVIDYMQLLSASSKNRREMSRAEELGAISGGCKEMAQELGIPVILLSQLTDEGKIYGSREPGHDADVVVKLKNDGDWMPRVQPVKLIIEKQRNGPTGEVDLTFLKHITRFESAAKGENEP